MERRQRPIVAELQALTQDLRAKEHELTKLDAMMADLEVRLNAIGEDAQLANIDLQTALQKQQATLQTMSTISKSMHDTTLAIIRKIGS